MAGTNYNTAKHQRNKEICFIVIIKTSRLVVCDPSMFGINNNRDTSTGSLHTLTQPRKYSSKSKKYIRLASPASHSHKSYKNIIRKVAD